MGYYRCFRTFAVKSLHFSFVSSGFELGPIANQALVVAPGLLDAAELENGTGQVGVEIALP
jgi:hypothetical protein